MIRLFGLLALVLSLSGCQRNSSVEVGGTPGLLRLGDAPLADFQIKVFGQTDGTLVGTGTTNWEGRFKLVNPDGKAPCWLPSGDFVCELESFGTEAPKLSPSYRDKAKSPLKIKWTDSQQQMELQIPDK
ncbi:MAG: hypothetical protein MUC43_03330 [Pirellula sp.]|jgi:hypothetical protein|nr:hypothetical protein [Pirellula sp.]